MPMNKYVLSSTPQKITDGTKLGLVQGMGKRDFYFAEGATAPSKDAYIYGHEVSFPVGAIIWAWSDSCVAVSVLTVE
ncbi:hypothetical protein SKM57_11155 [Acinetobacter faecalis]|uniref:hypothetical protein n=1 Tax=Acinetobacter faecalis TaxID=2665161 RepID=UPI002A91D162|nr:hypothetical protein [Acinetobacter faecalis]MDY6469137.1 hypothetical protein [Acinetobacter faecalis]